MAIMHFQHKSMGKTTHKSRMATSAVFYITRDMEAAQLGRDEDGQPVLATGRDMDTGRETFLASEEGHGPGEAVSYNARESAASVVIAGRMPADRPGACAFLEKGAAEDRKNARVCDTFIIGLPRELDKDQRVALLRDWCETVTKGKAAYFAAIHDKGRDADNPHAHVIIRDRDYSKDCPEKERGRVIGTTTNKEALERAERLGQPPPPRMTTWDLRASWAEAQNRAYERAGMDIQIDPRSYRAQGIDKEPGIHEGRNAHKLAAEGKTPQSQDREAGPTGREREVPYTAIDQGRSRIEENAARAARNAEREREQRTAGLAVAAMAVGHELADAMQFHARRAGQVVADERAAKSIMTGQAPDNRTQAREAATGGTSPQPAETQAQQVKALRDAQREDRKAMFAEHGLDRGAMRDLHKSELAAFKTWGREHINEARAHAFAAIGEQFQGRYAAARGIVAKEEREAMIAALKHEQSLAVQAAIRDAVAAARAERDAKAALLKAEQAQEKRALRVEHGQETKTLFGAQAADSKALAEKWQTYRETQQRGREDQEKRREGKHAVAAGTRADMPTQQREALRRYQAQIERASGPQPSAAICDGARRRTAQLEEQAKRWFEERRAMPASGREASREMTDRVERAAARVREKWKRGDYESQKDAVRGAKDGTER